MALRIVERQMTRFLRKPVSVRAAASVTALQTATTVGYGDVTPKDVAGRIVAAFVMLEGVAFLAIITAAITSTFVARAQREREGAEAGAEEQDEERLEARFDDLAVRLDRLEAMLGKLTKS